MSFDSVWGFDPEKAFRAQDSFRERVGEHESSYSTVEEQAAQIPTDVHAQIEVLQRMFGA